MTGHFNRCDDCHGHWTPGHKCPSPDGPAQEGKDQSAGGPERPQLDSTDAGAAPRPADPTTDELVRDLVDRLELRHSEWVQRYWADRDTDCYRQLAAEFVRCWPELRSWVRLMLNHIDDLENEIGELRELLP